MLLDGEVTNETQQRQHDEIVVDEQLADPPPPRPHTQSDKRNGGYSTNVPRDLWHGWLAGSRGRRRARLLTTCPCSLSAAIAGLCVGAPTWAGEAL